MAIVLRLLLRCYSQQEEHDLTLVYDAIASSITIAPLLSPGHPTSVTIAVFSPRRWFARAEGGMACGMEVAAKRRNDDNRRRHKRRCGTFVNGY